jgi:hypothetical protein
MDRFIFRGTVLSAVLLLGIATSLFVISPAQATVSTDQESYAPGSTVTISGDNSDGAGYAAGETVHVDVNGPGSVAASCDGTADDIGAWSCQITLPSDDSAVGGYWYTATGQSSGVSQIGEFTDSGCPNSARQGDYATSSDLTATSATNGNTVAFSFTSTGENPSGGIPGLIEYCVYPGTLPSSGAVDGSFPTTGCNVHFATWVYEKSTSGGYFDFGRCNGDPSNLPFDGTTHTMGTATWTSTPPTTQLIVLHINDPTECSRLYGAGTLTCFVLPGAGGGGGGGGGGNQDLTVTKSATPSLDRTYAWGITKEGCKHGVTPCKTKVKQLGGSVTYDYTIAVSHDGGTDGNWKVGGTITVTNPNSSAFSGVDVSDSVDDGGTCIVTNGSDQTVPANDSIQRDYTCTYSSAPNPASGTNTATASWDATTYDTPNGTATGTAEFDFSTTDPNVVHGCVSVSDSYSGGPQAQQACSTDASPKTFTYSRTVTVPANGCQDYQNTGTFTATDDSNYTGSAQATVTVCGPAKTGALTMGFWKGPNGNSLIQNYSAPSGGKPSLATYLSTLPGSVGGPFTDAASKSGSQLVTYVNGILNAASAKDMNKMLEAQMLSTALDVYFSTSSLGYTSTKVGSAKPPSNFLPNVGIGTFVMDLAAVCPMVDNLNTGTATCLNNTPSTDAYGSGAVPWASQSVNGILTFAATTGSSPWSTGAFTGTAPSDTWYATNRTKQETLKNIFDQINNQMAFAV